VDSKTEVLGWRRKAGSNQANRYSKRQQSSNNRSSLSTVNSLRDLARCAKPGDRMERMQATFIALAARSVFANARTATTLGARKVSNFLLTVLG
jgi:hypothetical protein